MRPLRTTRDRAATLARIMDAVEAGQPLTPSQVGYRPSILVEAINSIPGNTTAQHTVRIMEPLAGIPTATKATMLVRHCGVSTLAAGARLMAEYCGQLGYVIQRGGGAPKFRPVIQRFFTPSGPLAAEGQGEDTDWKWAAFNQYAPTRFHGLYGWTLPIDFSATPSIENYRAVWRVKGYPLRLKMTGYGDAYQGGNTRLQGPPYSTPSVESRLYDWFRYAPFYEPLRARFPLSSVTPPANSHLENFVCSGAYIRTVTEFHPFYNGVQIPQYYNGRWVGPQGFINWRKARVWIDGVDQSGIVTPSYFEFTENGNTLLVRGAKTTTPQTPAQKSIWLDMWVDAEYSVEAWAQGVVTGVQQAAILVGDYPPMLQGVIGQMDWFETVGTTRQWTLVFDANGPGGLTSLTSIAGGGVIWEGTGTPTNRVEWYTDTEVAYITVRKSGPHASPKAGTAVYLPENTNDYEPLRFANGGTLRAGCWDPDAATVYRRVGGNVSSMVIGGPAGWLDLHNAGDPTEWDALYNDYPETITVSPA